MAREGDRTPIAWMKRDERYVEKLATPDVTIADLIGDIDPIKAARGGHELGNELVIHYGLLPRANRGIFAVNELPDLAGKIQVGLFNIMQEGDVQIKGFPVRLPLDVALVFSANPEDYTARGKIVTPLKDRIGSEIRTHYPATIEEGMAITAQEAWCEREGPELIVPPYVRETCEQIAFVAREDKRVDRRSGVSQRLPISVLENVISNAERRAVLEGSSIAVPRISDIYAAMPSITGKLELEYEGEMKGADTVAREVIQASVAKTFDRYFGSGRPEAGGAVVRAGRPSHAHRQHAHRGTDSRAWRRFRACWRRQKRSAWARASRPSRLSPRRSSSWKDCTPTSASGAPRSASSPPATAEPPHRSARDPPRSMKPSGSSAKRIAARSTKPVH